MIVSGVFHRMSFHVDSARCFHPTSTSTIELGSMQSVADQVLVEVSQTRDSRFSLGETTYCTVQRNGGVVGHSDTPGICALLKTYTASSRAGCMRS